MISIYEFYQKIENFNARIEQTLNLFYQARRDCEAKGQNSKALQEYAEAIECIGFFEKETLDGIIAELPQVHVSYYLAAPTWSEAEKQKNIVYFNQITERLTTINQKIETLKQVREFTSRTSLSRNLLSPDYFDVSDNTLYIDPRLRQQQESIKRLPKEYREQEGFESIEDGTETEKLANYIRTRELLLWRIPYLRITELLPEKLQEEFACKLLRSIFKDYEIHQKAYQDIRNSILRLDNEDLKMRASILLPRHFIEAVIKTVGDSVDLGNPAVLSAFQTVLMEQGAEPYITPNLPKVSLYKTDGITYVSNPFNAAVMVYLAANPNFPSEHIPLDPSRLYNPSLPVLIPFFADERIIKNLQKQGLTLDQLVQYGYLKESYACEKSQNQHLDPSVLIELLNDNGPLLLKSGNNIQTLIGYIQWNESAELDGLFLWASPDTPGKILTECVSLVANRLQHAPSINIFAANHQAINNYPSFLLNPSYTEDLKKNQFLSYTSSDLVELSDHIKPNTVYNADFLNEIKSYQYLVRIFEAYVKQEAKQLSYAEEKLRNRKMHAVARHLEQIFNQVVKINIINQSIEKDIDNQVLKGQIWREQQILQSYIASLDSIIHLPGAFLSNPIYDFKTRLVLKLGQENNIDEIIKIFSMSAPEVIKAYESDILEFYVPREEPRITSVIRDGQGVISVALNPSQQQEGNKKNKRHKAHGLGNGTTPEHELLQFRNDTTLEKENLLGPKKSITQKNQLPDNHVTVNAQSLSSTLSLSQKRQMMEVRAQILSRIEIKNQAGFFQYKKVVGGEISIGEVTHTLPHQHPILRVVDNQSWQVGPKITSQAPSQSRYLTVPYQPFTYKANLRLNPGTVPGMVSRTFAWWLVLNQGSYGLCQVLQDQNLAFNYYAMTCDNDYVIQAACDMNNEVTDAVLPIASFVAYTTSLPLVAEHSLYKEWQLWHQDLVNDLYSKLSPQPKVDKKPGVPPEADLNIRQQLIELNILKPIQVPEKLHTQWQQEQQIKSLLLSK